MDFIKDEGDRIKTAVNNMGFDFSLKSEENKGKNELLGTEIKETSPCPKCGSSSKTHSVTLFQRRAKKECFICGFAIVMPQAGSESHFITPAHEYDVVKMWDRIKVKND